MNMLLPHEARISKKELPHLATRIRRCMQASVSELHSCDEYFDANTLESMRADVRAALQAELAHITDLQKTHINKSNELLYLDALDLVILGFSNEERENLSSSYLLTDDEVFMHSIDIRNTKTLRDDGQVFLRALNTLFGFGDEDVPLADTPEKKEILKQHRARKLEEEKVGAVGGW